MYEDNVCKTNMVSHYKPTLFPNKGQRPAEDVHEVGQPVWMRRTVELSDVHNVVFILQHGSCR